MTVGSATLSEPTIEEVVALAHRVCEENNYRSPKVFSTRSFAVICRFLSTDAILLISVDRAMLGYEDRWCYAPGTADRALAAWNGAGEPEGWHRHPTTGRRRPNGDASLEYINP
jgi:hypothetical protein